METVYPPHALSEQILKPREGHVGLLTNRNCTKYKGEKCVVAHLTNYDLGSVEFRETVNRLNFICRIAGKRYKICLDKPGYCHHYTAQKPCGPFGWFNCDDRREEFLPAKEQHQFLLDAKASCFNREEYSPDE